MRTELIALALLWPMSAYPITRIGNNSIGEPKEGYSARVPATFLSIEPDNARGLTLDSGRVTALADGSPLTMPVSLQVRPLASEHPEFKGQTDDAIATQMLSSKRVKFERQRVETGVVLFGESPTIYTGLIMHDGRGYVVFGPKTREVREAIHELLDQTRFGEAK